MYRVAFREKITDQVQYKYFDTMGAARAFQRRMRGAGWLAWTQYQTTAGTWIG
jgi:hypothetical protein